MSCLGVDLHFFLAMGAWSGVITDVIYLQRRLTEKWTKICVASSDFLNCRASNFRPEMNLMQKESKIRENIFSGQGNEGFQLSCQAQTSHSSCQPWMEFIDICFSLFLFFSITGSLGCFFSGTCFFPFLGFCFFLTFPTSIGRYFSTFSTSTG